MQFSTTSRHFGFFKNLFFMTYVGNLHQLECKITNILKTILNYEKITDFNPPSRIASPNLTDIMTSGYIAIQNRK
jgi:hypothetical protein